MACQDHVILTCDKISLGTWVRQSERKEWKMFTDVFHWPGGIDSQCIIFMCVSARWHVWADAADGSVREVLGVACGWCLGRQCCRKQHRARGVKTAWPLLPSSTQPLATAVILPWQQVPPSWCDAYLYSWFNFEVAGLILLYDSSASRALGGLEERLLAAEPLMPCSESDNYTF